MSAKSLIHADDSSGLSIGVEETMKNAQSTDLRSHCLISSVIGIDIIVLLYNRMVRTNSRQIDESAPIRKGGRVPDSNQYHKPTLYDLVV